MVSGIKRTSVRLQVENTRTSFMPGSFFNASRAESVSSLVKDNFSLSSMGAVLWFNPMSMISGIVLSLFCKGVVMPANEEIHTYKGKYDDGKTDDGHDG